MTLTSVVAAGVGFGIAGMGPLGALFVIPLVMNGVRSRVIVAFAAMSIVSAVGAGVMLGESVEHLWPWIVHLLTISDSARLTLHVAGVAVLGIAFVHLLRHRNDPKKERRHPTILTGTAGMALMGTIWGLISLTDPTFYGLAAVMRSAGFFTTAFAFTLWIVISQSPLFIVVIAMIIGRDSAAMRHAISFANRLDRFSIYAVLGAIAIIGAYLAGSAAGYLATGMFMPF